MQFTIPTTKQEMYTTLQEIFYYYRIRREAWEGVTLKPLEIPRLEFNLLTDAQLREKAVTLVTPGVERESNSAIVKLQEQVDTLTKENSLLSTECSQAVSKIRSGYLEQTQKVQAEAFKRGISESSIVIKEINEIESVMNAEITQTQNIYSQRQADNTAQIQALTQRITDTREFYSQLLQKEIDAKTQQLKDEQTSAQIGVVKYNNDLDEKEIKHDNAIVRQQVSLELRYRELSYEFFTKDQLVEMGYYDDVIRCICGYYDTLSAMSAFQDFSGEGKLAVYLDEYYVDILYMYRTRAGQ